MRKTKLGAVLATLAIATGTATLIADAPAQATTPVTTKATLTMNSHGKVKGQYGDLVGFLEARVTDSSGNSVFAGSAVLQQKLPGKGWAKAKTDSDGTDGFDFGSYGSHAKGNVQYRLHFLGGTDTTTSTTYAESFSKVVTVTTLWNFKDTSACPRQCHLSGKLIPKTKHHKILVQVKHGSWKKYKVLHTSAKGTYRVNVTGSRKGTKYRIIITATKSITATKKGYVVTLI